MAKHIELQDLAEIPNFSAPAYQPNGQGFIYVKTTLSFIEDNYQSSIIYHDFSNNEEQVLITGSGRNYAPVWDELGEWFLFLSNRTGFNQVYCYKIATKEVIQLTDTLYGVQELAVSVTNDCFYFTTKVTKGQKKVSWQDPKLETSLVYATENILYKANGTGLLDENSEMMLCCQKLTEQVADVITSVSLGYGLRKSFALAPNGEFIACEQAVAPTDPYNQDTTISLHSVKDKNAVGEKILQQFTETGIFGEPCYSSDGRYLALIGCPKKYQTINQLTVFIYDFHEESLTEYLQADDIQVTDFCVCDFKQTNTTAQLQWSSETQSFYALVSKEGCVGIYEVIPESKMTTEIFLEKAHVQDFCLSPGKCEMLLILSAPDNPSSIEVLNLETKQREVLVNSVTNSEWQFAEYVTCEYTNGSNNRVPALLVTPPECQSDRKYPMIVNIHGGPYTMHGYTFHHEMQLMASEGYMVLLVNPRGSFGYGQHHLAGVLEHYGEGDYQDIMVAVDNVLKDYQFIDPDRLFVTGGSYGGFMCNWITTQNNRFRAAATQRSMSNFVSMVGTSDIGYHFFVEENGADILQADKLWAKSPLAYVKNVKTPTLIVHAEEDERCPMEQAEQWFTALKYIGVATRFVRFAKENHEMSRTGRPSSRERRLQEIMSWFKQHDVD